MADQIRVNENIHSWGSISLKAGGQRYFGFTAVSYGHKRERSYVWGMGKHQAPRGRTRGKYTPQPGKLKGPKSSVQALRDQLAALSQDGKSYGNVEFEIVVQFVEADETPITVVLERCVITGEDASHEEGPDALEDELEISYMMIRKNGKYLADVTQGRP